MPHQLATYRDDIDALIGPLEEIMAKLENLPKPARESYIGGYTAGGIQQAIDTLQDGVNEIDEFVEPEPEPEEPETEDADDEDEDDDSED